MPESEKAPPSPRSGWLGRRWVRRLAGAVVAVGFLTLIFHRPLLTWALRTVAVQIARHENLTLSLEVEGSLLNTLVIKNVKGGPAKGEEGLSPVQKLEIGYARFDYSFPRLLRQGVTEFISSYELRDATVQVKALPASRKRRPHRLTRLLRDVLQQPVLFSNRVQIRNFNLAADLPGGTLALTGAGIELHPDRPGFIAIQQAILPGIDTRWRNLHAPATYSDRHLIVGPLLLGGAGNEADGIELRRLELDGSRRAAGFNQLTAEGRLFGGETRLLVQQQRQGKGSDVQISASLRGLSLEALSRFLGREPGISGRLSEFSLDLHGMADIPSSWRGEARMNFENGRFGEARIEKAETRLILADGALQLRQTVTASPGNEVVLQAERPLPDTLRSLRREGLEATVALAATDLARLHPGFAPGAASAKGTLRVNDKEVGVSLHFSTPGLEWAAPSTIPESDLREPFRIVLGRGEGEITAAYEFGPHKRNQANRAARQWVDGLTLAAKAAFTPPEGQGRSETAALRAGPMAFDAASAAFNIAAGTLTLEAAEFRRGVNTAKAEGHFPLPSTLSALKWDELAFDTRFEIDAPALAELNPGKSGDSTERSIRGSLRASGEYRKGRDGAHGHGLIEGRDLAFREFSARQLSVEAPVEGEIARVSRFEIDLNGIDKIAGEGSLQLRPPFAYSGKVVGKVADLAVFQPLVKAPIGGVVDIDWRGEGRLHTLLHSGSGRLTIQNGRAGTLTGLEGEIAGAYSPESVDFPAFRFRSNQGSVEATMTMADGRLQIRNLRAEFGEGERRGEVSGQLSLPLDLGQPDRPETLLPPGGALDGELTLRQIDLARFLPDAEPAAGARGKKARGEAAAGLQGTVDLTFKAGGTVGAPDLLVAVKGRNLRSRHAEKVQPASVDASLRFHESRLVVGGEVKIPTLSPLRVDGEIPLDLYRVAREKRLDPATPVKLAVRLPASSAGVLAQLSPSIRYIEGRLSLDASATGTLEKPVFGGGLQFSFPAVRFQNADLPGINRFEGELRFSDHQLAIRRFEGDAAGGLFKGSGRINLEKWNEPALDLRFKSERTLLVRNDSMIVRADSDLKIAGPLNAAHVSGKVSINNSRFFREVEILPIGLPGRPAPEKTGGPVNLSIDAPPLRNWTFDVAIHTTEPFLVRSNLARGRTLLDLKLGGTGLAPTLDGTAKIENFVASLPFSRLEIDHGFVRFNPADSFNPTLDIHGSSRLRDYTINVHIYGTANAPETVFNSEPPLPQEEIIALLATGVTTQEFTDNNQVLAGRAGVLLLQDLYRKVFKPKTPPLSADRATRGEKPFIERFHLDVGTVDPRTGRQQVGGRFELSRQFEVGAGMDLEGDVKVQLRYLLRFR